MPTKTKRYAEDDKWSSINKVLIALKEAYEKTSQNDWYSNHRGEIYLPGEPYCPVTDAAGLEHVPQIIGSFDHVDDANFTVLAHNLIKVLIELHESLIIEIGYLFSGDEECRKVSEEVLLSLCKDYGERMKGDNNALSSV